MLWCAFTASRRQRSILRCGSPTNHITFRLGDAIREGSIHSNAALERSGLKAGKIITKSGRGSRNWPECSGLMRSEEHTSELQSQSNLVCRLLLEKKKKTK